MASDTHYLSVILSAFEELKEGRRVELLPSSQDDSHSKARDIFGDKSDERMSREGSEEDQQSVSGSSGYDPLSFTEGRLGGRSRISRDERVALEAGLPLSALEIIRMPVEEFNGYMNGQIGHLGTDQIQMMKDIRRRGKNKVAAQNCRKRKIDNVSHLEREIMGIREELKREAERRDDLLRLRDFHRAALAGSSAAVIPPIASTTSSLPAKQHATKPIRKRKRPDE